MPELSTVPASFSNIFTPTFALTAFVLLLASATGTPTCFLPSVCDSSSASANALCFRYSLRQKTRHLSFPGFKQRSSQFSDALVPRRKSR